MIGSIRERSQARGASTAGCVAGAPRRSSSHIQPSSAVGSGACETSSTATIQSRARRQAEYLALAAQLNRAERRNIPKRPIGTRRIELEQFAVHAAHVLRSDGWRSREQARRFEEPATVERALRSLQSTPDAIDDGDRALAAAALRWARVMLPTKPAPSAFERAALAVVIPGSMLAPRELGRVCALVMVYRRRHASSQHLAQPGARVQVTVLGESHRATLRTARHRAPLRADRRRRQPADLVANPRRGPVARGGDHARRACPAPHPLRRRPGRGARLLPA